ncbi:MAG: acyl--CoA ligase [Candidatus Omnitrophica bacterium]|nr:acyl--CoA ligase [Candidatus Omnitrophota bacterium]
MLLLNFLRKSAEKYPDKAVVVYQKTRLTYKELDDSSNGFASTLIEKKVKKGDRVVLFIDNSCDYLIAYFGISKTEAIIVALNSQLVPRELAVLLNDCAPKVIVTDKKHKKVVEDALALINQDIAVLQIDALDYSENHEPLAMSYELSDSGLALIIYTSGTTGKPKGVMLSHGNISANADSIIEYLHLKAEDRIMVVLPFYYSYGNSLLTTHIKAGGTLIIDNRFMYPNVVLDNMIKEEVTGFAGVPSHFNILIKKSAIAKYSFPKLRYVTQAGGAMMPAMIKEFLSIVPNTNFYVMYGQTEASARLSYLKPEYLKKKLGSIGKAIPGVELLVLNEDGRPVKEGQIGEIVAKGYNIMQGYWNSPEETALVLKKEGLWTGDLARVDEEGYIYLISRKKDMIKSGANRISPFEIEDIVCRLENIVECAAVGIPDEILGEAIALFIVTDGFIVKEQELMLFCKQNLAVYKLPKRIECINELPKTASGKIKREELKKLIADS